MRIFILLVSLTLAAPGYAQSTPPSQSAGSSVGIDIADIVFKEVEKRAIEEFYKHVPSTRADEEAKKNDDRDGGKARGKKDKDAKGNGRGNGLPPGLVKRDQLPPGLAKRGNRLPSGLMKSDLPPELEGKLPVLPENIERVVIDDDVLLVQKGTDLILDVLDGVLAGQ